LLIINNHVVFNQDLLFLGFISFSWLQTLQRCQAQAEEAKKRLKKQNDKAADRLASSVYICQDGISTKMNRHE
jgi:hypothetical protein